MTDNDLYLLAKKAFENSYSPYSKFRVGAALLCEDGKVFTGCNIENATFGATVCAERVAIFNAISQGERKLLRLAIASDSNDFTYPCGVCRQVIAEFNDDMVIIVGNNEGIRSHPISELLPYSFKFKNSEDK